MGVRAELHWQKDADDAAGRDGKAGPQLELGVSRVNKNRMAREADAAKRVDRDAQVTIGIPFYGHYEHLQDCLDSIADQTHPSVRTIVIADGRKPKVKPPDNCVIYTLPRNRGTYFCRALALAATTTEWHMPVDADDWLDPHAVSLFLGKRSDVALLSGRYEVTDGEARWRPWPRAREKFSGQWRHFTSHIGLWRTEYLRDLGGYSPAYRTSWDSMLVMTAYALGVPAVLETPVYYRRRHDQQLTRAPQSGIGSPSREANREVLQAAFKRIVDNRDDREQVRKIIDSLTPTRLWVEVEKHARKIRG